MQELDRSEPISARSDGAVARGDLRRDSASSRTLGRQLAVPLLVGAVAIMAVLVLAVFKLQLSNVETQATKQAEAVIAQMLATRSAYTANVVAKLKADGAPVGFGVDFADQASTIPLPATLVHLIAEQVNEQGLYQIDLISPWAINPDKSPRTEWEQTAMAALIADPESTQRTTQSIDGDPTLLYMQADFASSQACATCHNEHPDSPRTDFEVGDMMGALVVQTPLAAPTSTARNQALWLGLALLVGVAAYLALILRYQKRAVARPVAELTEVAGQLAQGNLEVEVEVANYSKNEIGRMAGALGNVVSYLRSLIGQVGSTVGEVRAAGDQISEGAQSLAEATNQQAVSLDQVSSTVEQLSAMTELNSTNATEARDLAAQSKTLADTGKESIDQLQAAIGDIRGSATETAKVAKTIEEIAFQTNLLALNAAVEAARAGDAGKGFAVVAEEVRALAQRSAEAAKTTGEMIESSVSAAEKGVEIGGMVESGFGQILDSSDKVNDIVNEIAMSSVQQAEGIKEMGAALTKINQVTQENAAFSEESAAAAEQLSAQVSQLGDVIGRFRTGNNQTTPHPTPNHPTPTTNQPASVIPLTDDEAAQF